MAAIHYHRDGVKHQNYYRTLKFKGWSKMELLDQVKSNLVSLEIGNISAPVSSALEKGIEANDIMDVLGAGMEEVGRLFEEGEYFLTDLVLAGEIMKKAVAIIEPHLKIENRNYKGNVVVCAVKGDLHDLGKNIVKIMLTSAGFNVIDLGIDVHEDQIVEAIEIHRPVGIGLTSLITTTVPSIAETISAIEGKGLRADVKIAIGGAGTTNDLAKSLGADAWGADAVEAVRIFEQFINVSTS
jgi:5-methyltetrahydrofolate--homocysteine methyltransferase